MEKFNKLLEYGQSCWLDNLSREIIKNGELEKRFKNEGLRGITSNPKVFMKAISNGELYDGQIHELAKRGKNPQEIYEALAVEDIKNACGLLRPVIDASKGKDGYVSLEVSPCLRQVDSAPSSHRVAS